MASAGDAADGDSTKPLVPEQPSAHVELSELPEDLNQARRNVQLWTKQSEDEVDFLRRRVKRLKEAELNAIKTLEATQKRTEVITDRLLKTRAHRKEIKQYRESLVENAMKEKRLVQLARDKSRQASIVARSRVDVERREQRNRIQRDTKLNTVRIAFAKEEDRERRWRIKNAIKDMQARAKGDREEVKVLRSQSARTTQRNALGSLLEKREHNIEESAQLLKEQAVLFRRLRSLNSRNVKAKDRMHKTTRGGIKFHLSDDGDIIYDDADAADEDEGEVQALPEVIIKKPHQPGTTMLIPHPPPPRDKMENSLED